MKMSFVNHMIFLLISGFPVWSHAQVKVGSTSDAPHQSAQLEVESTERGLLPPRMTSEQRDAIVSPAEGLRIYNLTTRCENYFNGISWFELCGSCVPGIPAPPGIISGSVSFCGTGDQSYSIDPVALATSYSWTLPAGLSITSGENTNEIIVTPDAEFEGGEILVAASNSCGTSAPSGLTVSRLLAGTGGNISQSGGYTIHTFTSSGTFVNACASEAEILVVAGGGGGGGGWEGAGGGGGGVSWHPAFSLSSGGSYNVVVGAGGAAGPTGSNGQNSSFAGSVISIGGGGGGSLNVGPGLNGGSGGGGARDVGSGISTQTNSGGATGYGNAGGGGINSSAIRIGGGGGAGEPGESPSQDEYGGKGGDGLAFDISGVSTYYGGGGGSGGGTLSGNGGLGGGGKGSRQGDAGSAVNGTPNTGGGGGGERWAGYGGGNGGSGVVIIRYLSE